MSRLRRLVMSDRYFFMTCRLPPRRRILTPEEFPGLAGVIDERDHALPTVCENHEKVAYIHFNPVRAGRVMHTKDGAWSSVHDYTGYINDQPLTPSGLSVDRVILLADLHTRI